MVKLHLCTWAAIPQCRFQWPSGLRRGSASDRLLRLRDRIPPRSWMFVLCVLYSKDKRHNQDTELRIKYKERTKEVGIATHYGLYGPGIESL